MSHDYTRKHFLAKLSGLFAAVCVAPKLLVKPAQAQARGAAAASTGLSVPIQFRPESRAVVRGADSV